MFKCPVCQKEITGAGGVDYIASNGMFTCSRGCLDRYNAVIKGWLNLVRKEKNEDRDMLE